MASSEMTISANKRYRIDFALIVLTGNITRYKLIRPLVERDPSIEARWYPIRTWFKDDVLRFLPGVLRVRVRHLLDSWPAYVNPPPEAIVIHAFETYYLYVAFKLLLRRKTIIVNNPDAGITQSRLYSFAVRHTDLFIPWSNWAAQEMKMSFPGISDKKIVVLHPGINLKKWPMRTQQTPGKRFKLLFVGGDFLRKGGDTLLDAFVASLHEYCDLSIATQSGYLSQSMRERIMQTPNVTLYLDLTSNSDTLKRLYQESDCFVMPTRDDASSWVALESLATGIPVIISNVGGITDIVIDHKTGMIVPPDNPQAIIDVVNCLRNDHELILRLIRQGREHVETNYDAERNTERLMTIIKTLIDQNQHH